MKVGGGGNLWNFVVFFGLRKQNPAVNFEQFWDGCAKASVSVREFTESLREHLLKLVENEGVENKTIYNDWS